jgi:NADP-dependent 3-hydroxy acid dehydrogenase YdfG
MTTNLDGAVVAVVGASGGLGEPIARLLAERGARLLLAGRRTGRLDALAIDGASTIALDVEAGSRSSPLRTTFSVDSTASSTPQASLRSDR